MPMDDYELDRMLQRAEPASRHTQVADASLEELVLQLSRRRRWRQRPVAVISIAGALMLAGTTAAVAGSDIVTRLSWTGDNSTVQSISSGDTCDLTFRVVPLGVPSDDPSVVYARQFLTDLDIQSLDLTDEIANVKRQMSQHEWAGEGPPWKPTASDIESSALYDAVWHEVLDAVSAQGLDRGHIGMDASAACGDDPITHD